MAVAGAESPAPPPAGGPDVLLTRRRWSWYFVPATVAAAVLGGAAALASGEARFLAAPAAVLALWWWVRRGTPPQGMRGRRVSADPFVRRLAAWGGFCLLLIVGAEWADGYATGRPFGAPYPAHQLAAVGTILAVFFAGVFLIARREDRRRRAERGRAAEPGAAADRAGGRP
jgi:hypothetical protein